ncbi:MAG: P-loop NTPase [Candidatus Omnitrophica bacterium]|nr:P-loop NTPase [Candidatus Omnitrophota bacterium]
MKNVSHIIAVSSCKGGVGKSTIAALMAQELSRRGFKTGLLDADIYGPSLPSLFHLANVAIRSDEFKQIVPLDHQGLKMMSFGFLLGDAPAVLRGPIVTRYIQQMLFNVAWGELDYLIIDMPPGTGDVQLTITQSVRLTGAVIVTTRHTLSLVDVARGILMFEKVQVPILGIIENMAYFVCDSCQKKHDIFGEARALEKRFGVKTLAEIPLDPSLHLQSYISESVEGLLKVLKDQNQQISLPEVSFDAQHIRLKFIDGKEKLLNNRDVRLSCGCALCADELTGKKILNPAKIRLDIAPKEIIPLGNYAVGITWNDGHSSGIYPYENLLSLVVS